MLDKGLAGAHAKLTDFVGKANSLLATIGVGVSAGAVAGFLADATKKAADLGETMSKVEQTFGTSKTVVTAMAQDMADKFGAVKQVTLDAASSFGLIFQGAGMTADAAAQLSVKLTRLADDASSFYNVPLEEALQKIRSGLVGEAEPLRAFGVLINEDAVKQEALASGIAKTTKELTDQEKVAARAELIQKQLTKAAGDHERTLDSLTNQLRKFNGEYENFKTDVGNALLPSATGVVAGGNRLIGGMKDIYREIFGEARPTIDEELAAVNKLRNPKVRYQERMIEFARQRGEEDRAIGQKMWDDKKFTPTPGGGPFGFMGMMGVDLTKQALLADVNEQIAAKRKQMDAWGGGHIMDTSSFLRSAQEKILDNGNETEKKQLEELIKAREALEKLVGKPQGPALAVVGPKQ